LIDEQFAIMQILIVPSSHLMERGNIFLNILVTRICLLALHIGTSWRDNCYETHRRVPKRM